jgi:hypothetical protein
MSKTAHEGATLIKSFPRIDRPPGVLPGGYEKSGALTDLQDSSIDRDGLNVPHPRWPSSPGTARTATRLVASLLQPAV